MRVPDIPAVEALPPSLEVGISEASVNLLLVIPWCAGGGRSPWHPRIWGPTSPYTVSDVRAGYTPCTIV